MLDIRATLMCLSKQRHIFFSEADFQHSLAWELHNNNPRIKIRLEYNPSDAEDNIHVDIWCIEERSILGIELKYKTKDGRYRDNGEGYNLRNHSAYDCARYDYLVDVKRLEGLKKMVPLIKDMQYS